MGTAIKFVNGVPTTVEVQATPDLTYYDESIPVTTDIGTPGTGYDAAHEVFTLPNAETYDATKDQLKVEVNGVGQVEGVHFNYGSGTEATTITFLTPWQPPNGARVRLFKVS